MTGSTIAPLNYVTYFGEEGEKQENGFVKIGQFGMAEGQGCPSLPDTFDELGDRFSSLGQDADYYSALINLGPETAREVLAALNDIAADDTLYQKTHEEDVTGRSLLRS